MKKTILIFIAFALQLSAQTNITIPQLNLKSVLDSTDLFLISQTDTNYYKYQFDNLVDQVEDSLNKSQIAYKNTANTFSGAQTLSGGLTSSNTTTISGPATFSNTLTINGGATFNARPTLYGALFDAATYGLVRFNDSTYFYGGQTTFYNNPVVFDGNSNITVYGSQNFISGGKLRLPSAIYSLDFSALGYVGSDGGAYLSFDYGSTTGQRDTIPGIRYLRSNYAGLASNNAFTGTNTFSNTSTFSGQSVFNNRVTLNEQFVNQIDSVAYGVGTYTLDVSNRSPLIVIYGTDDAPAFNDITGYHGQEVTFLIHPSTYTTVTFANGTSIKCKNNANAVLNGKDMITFINYWGVWYEKSRSEN